MLHFRRHESASLGLEAIRSRPILKYGNSHFAKHKPGINPCPVPTAYHRHPLEVCDKRACTGAYWTEISFIAILILCSFLSAKYSRLCVSCWRDYYPRSWTRPWRSDCLWETVFPSSKFRALFKELPPYVWNLCALV